MEKRKRNLYDKRVKIEINAMTCIMVKAVMRKMRRTILPDSPIELQDNKDV